MKTEEIKNSELYKKFCKALSIGQEMRLEPNPFVLECIKIAEEHASQFSPSNSYRTTAEGLPDAETVQQKVRDIIDGNTGDNDISIWKNIIEWYQGIASQVIAKKDDEIFNQGHKIKLFGFEVSRLEEELAKEKAQSETLAIEFNEWLQKSEYNQLLNGVWVDTKLGMGTNKKTTQELFKLFLTEKEKQK